MKAVRADINQLAKNLVDKITGKYEGKLTKKPKKAKKPGTNRVFKNG